MTPPDIEDEAEKTLTALGMWRLPVDPMAIAKEEGIEAGPRPLQREVRRADQIRQGRENLHPLLSRAVPRADRGEGEVFDRARARSLLPGAPQGVSAPRPHGGITESRVRGGERRRGILGDAIAKKHTDGPRGRGVPRHESVYNRDPHRAPGTQPGRAHRPPAGRGSTPAGPGHRGRGRRLDRRPRPPQGRPGTPPGRPQRPPPRAGHPDRHRGRRGPAAEGP